MELTLEGTCECSILQFLIKILLRWLKRHIISPVIKVYLFGILFLKLH